MRIKIAIVASLLAFAQAAQAQTTYQWVLPPAVTPGAKNFYLPLGTSVRLKTVTEISSRDNKAGDRVYLEVAENVTFRGQTVIPAGSPVLGQVAYVQRNGHLGKRGEVGLRLIEIDTPSGPVKINGNVKGAGHSQHLLAWGTFLFVTDLGFFIHGTTGKVMPGTPVDGQLMSDMQFTWYPNGDAARLGDATPAQSIDVNRIGMRDTTAEPGFSH